MKKTLPIHLLVLVVVVLASCTPASTPVRPVRTQAPLRTRTVPPTVTPVSTSFRVYSPEEAKRVNFDTKKTIEGATFITKSEPLLLGRTWCATTDAILADNLKSMTWIISIEGVQLSADKFTYREYTDSKLKQKSCAGYYVVLDNWLPGVYHFQAGYTIDKPINDGISDYPADATTYLDDCSVYVLEKSTSKQDYSEWPVVYQNDFSKEIENWSAIKFDTNNFHGSTEVKEGKYRVVLNSVSKDFTSGTAIYVYIGTDTYYVSVDSKTTDVNVDNGSCYGFWLLSQTGAYTYGICDDAFYRLLKSTNGMVTILANKAYSGIKKDDFNTIGMLVSGYHVQLYINGNRVSEADIDTKPGYVALAYTANAGNVMSFEFKNLAIRMPVKADGITPAH